MAPAHWSIDCFCPLPKKKWNGYGLMVFLGNHLGHIHNSLLGGGPWLRQCVTPLPAPLQLTATNDVPIVRHQMPLPSPGWATNFPHFPSIFNLPHRPGKWAITHVGSLLPSRCRQAGSQARIVI